MQPKPRRTVYREAIRTLYDKFIRPLALSYTSGEEDPRAFQDGIEQVFNFKTRELWVGEAKESFRMPGKTWRGGRHDDLEVGVHDRQVKAGDLFIVRLDTNMPDRVELEKGDDRGHEDSPIIFVLSRAQFAVIREHLRVII